MKKPTFAEILDALQSGRADRRTLYGLSNLERSQAEAVWAVWGGLPVDTRRKMAQMMVEIAENDFEVNFDEVFRRVLDDPDAAVRLAAVEGLWENEDIRLVPVLADVLLNDPSAEVRAAAATSLGRFMLSGELGKIRPRPHQQAFQALMAACTNEQEDLEVRRRALESLAYSGEEIVAELIRAAYRHPDERMRVSAVFAMGRSADDRWASEVMRELHSPSPQMRYEAARACGELELTDAVPVLLELIEDVDTEVQEAAIWALGQIGGDEARQALDQCRRSDNEALRGAARDALRELEFLHGDLGAFLLFDFFDEEDEEDEDGDEEWEPV
ncbi:MAG: HEAT repeat domain-containing protein [Anaerolineae bacterium]|nr:HEAT repeat domain-containing protein [Anaerolineae bacterium]MDW8067326.1 HEAT repeat domain-containing protein [Anaerolineae bacterium]